jgi:hypothetical protein
MFSLFIRSIAIDERNIHLPSNSTVNNEHIRIIHHHVIDLLQNERDNEEYSSSIVR